MRQQNKKWSTLAIESYLLSYSADVEKWVYNEGRVDWHYLDGSIYNQIDDDELRDTAIIRYLSKIGEVSRSALLQTRRDPSGKKFYRYDYLDVNGSNKMVIAFYACAADGGFNRFIERLPDGHFIAYSEDHLSDEYGFLPTGMMNEEEAKEFGELTEILEHSFDEIWFSISPINPISIY